MMEKTIEAMMGRQVTAAEDAEMRAIFENKVEPPVPAPRYMRDPKKRAKAKAARSARRKNR